MISFKEFLLGEDFNSKTAKEFQFETQPTHPRAPVVFFEEIPERPFSLKKYMDSFESGGAKNILKTKNGYRGIIFDTGNKLLIFVWSDAILHNFVCKDLDANKMTKKYPSDIGYLKTYNSTYLLSKGDKVKNPWCFTFTFRDNHLSSNLSKEALIALSEQKDIGNLFKFSDIELQKMIKNGM